MWKLFHQLFPLTNFHFCLCKFLLRYRIKNLCTYVFFLQLYVGETWHKIEWILGLVALHFHLQIYLGFIPQKIVILFFSYLILRPFRPKSKYSPIFEIYFHSYFDITSTFDLKHFEVEIWYLRKEWCILDYLLHQSKHTSDTYVESICFLLWIIIRTAFLFNSLTCWNWLNVIAVNNVCAHIYF